MTTMDSSVDGTDAILAAVGDVRGRFGNEILRDRRRLSGLLNDIVPEQRREIRLLMTALDDGIPADLERARADQIGLEVQRLTGRLVQDHALREDSARWSVDTWAKILGIDTTAAVAAVPDASDLTWDDPADAGEPDGGADDDWVGLDDPAPQPVARPAAQTPREAYAHAPVHGHAAPVYTSPPPGRGAWIWRIVSQVLAVLFLLFVGLLILGLIYGEDPETPQPVQPAGPEVVDRTPVDPAPVQPADPVQPATPDTPVQPPDAQTAGRGEFVRLATEAGQDYPIVPLERNGNSVQARFAAPVGGRELYVQANLHPDNGTAAWIVTDDVAAGAPSSISIGSLIVPEPEPDGSRWLASQATWTVNELQLPGLCLVMAADAGGTTARDGGEICLMDANCQATLACGRIATR